MLKKFVFLFVGMMLMTALSTTADAQSFRLFMKSGEALEYQCADVDSIVFVAPETASPTFELAVTNVTATTATLSVTPDDNTVRYYYDCVTAAQYESAGSNVASIVENYITTLVTNYPSLSKDDILNALLAQGPDSDGLSGLPAGTDFVFYAIAVDTDGKCYGDASTMTFSTLPGGDPAACTFDISYTGLTSEGLTVLVTPSDDSVPYWMGIAAYDDYPGDKAMQVDVKTAIEEYAAEKGMTVEQVVNGVTFTGACSSEESGLSAETTYYIYVYAMDKTGASAGKMYKEKFTTRLYDYSDAAVSLKYRYFNGDDLYALDNETYGTLKGKVYIQTVLTPNESAANWVLALAKGDLSDETTYPEESTKNAVLQGGFLNKTEQFLVADWTTCTFLYYASDAYGVDGELRRLVVTFDPSGASPAEALSSDSEEAGGESGKKDVRIDTANVSTAHKGMPSSMFSNLGKTITIAPQSLVTRRLNGMLSAKPWQRSSRRM